MGGLNIASFEPYLMFIYRESGVSTSNVKTLNALMVILLVESSLSS